MSRKILTINVPHFPVARSGGSAVVSPNHLLHRDMEQFAAGALAGLLDIPLAKARKGMEYQWRLGSDGAHLDCLVNTTVGEGDDGETTLCGRDIRPIVACAFRDLQKWSVNARHGVYSDVRYAKLRGVDADDAPVIWVDYECVPLLMAWLARVAQKISRDERYHGAELVVGGKRYSLDIALPAKLYTVDEDSAQSRVVTGHVVSSSSEKKTAVLRCTDDATLGQRITLAYEAALVTKGGSIREKLADSQKYEMVKPLVVAGHPFIRKGPGGHHELPCLNVTDLRSDVKGSRRRK